MEATDTWGARRAVLKPGRWCWRAVEVGRNWRLRSPKLRPTSSKSIRDGWSFRPRSLPVTPSSRRSTTRCASCFGAIAFGRNGSERGSGASHRCRRKPPRYSRPLLPLSHRLRHQGGPCRVRQHPRHPVSGARSRRGRAAALLSFVTARSRRADVQARQGELKLQ